MIENEIRKLFEYPMNEYQNPGWVQAAELFVNVVVPWKSVYISNDRLYILAQKIVKEAKNHNSQVTYYYKGRYNSIANTPPKERFTQKKIADFSNTTQKIEQWNLESNQSEKF